MASTLSRKPRKKHPWYSFDRMLSYGALFNFCAGGRGMGKTYDAKKRSMKKALKSKFVRVDGVLNSENQFILLRRYKEEMQMARRTFFADFAHEFPDWELAVDGWKMRARPVLEEIEGESELERKKRDRANEWIIVGYFVALSQSQNVKGSSFHNVTTIIFDEFIVMKGRQYLPKEAEAFLEFYSTVDRYQDKTIVLFCANAVSIMNPYFLYWDIRPDQMEELTPIGKDPETGLYALCVHFPDAAEFKNSVYNTRFGKIIQGTAYGDYAVENNFDDANNNLIDIKTPESKHQYNLETKNGIVAVWFDRYEQHYYIQKKLPKSSNLNLTILPERMRKGWNYVQLNHKLLQDLRAFFSSGRMSFDMPTTRNIFVEIGNR